MTMPVLTMNAIAKDFGPVRVLFGVNFSLEPGEVHALVGENGAGKSTLMKIASGYLQPTEGRIEVDGKAVTIPDSGAGEQLGIVLIHQEFNLAEDLTIEENIFLGRERTRLGLLDKRSMVQRSREVLRELETDLDPRQRVRSLSVSAKQMVEIAKALSRNARILIMDEPTAVLTGAETAILFRLIARLKAQGVSIVYISHKLDEVKAIADRTTILRDGQLIATRDTASLSTDEMASLMVGRDLHDMYPDKTALPDDAPVVFAAADVSVPGWVKHAAFELRRGEILGFAGLVGAGRTELFEGILGLRPRTSGRFWRHGKPVTIRHLRDATRLGIAYLSEDRKGKGLITSMLLRPNLTLLSLDKYARPFIDERKELRALEGAVKTFDIRAPRLETRADTLSGGNQQKLVLAKIMETLPDILILDEPTRGIDIATKRQIYYFIHDLAAQGKSCIVISSEMPELIGLCHRVVVMRSGVVSGVLEGDEITEETIVRYAMGLKGVA